MGREWKCMCKDCGQMFTYSDTKYEAGAALGHSRPERCDNCRAHHSRELQSIGQPYYVVKAIKPIGDPRRLTSDLGRFDREDRPHEAVDTTPPPIDPNKFGIKDDRLVEMFHFFKQDPGLQVVVVVGPTGSGKSTYFPYRLVELPENYLDEKGNRLDTYWTVPIETDRDLEAADTWVKEQAKLKGTGEHTIYVKGHQRHYISKPNDPRAIEHKVSGPDGLDAKMFWRYGQIVVTQPRIQATRNIPDFIARAMMGCNLGAGHDVGFRHSGSPNSDWSTKLAFVTDGTLITWIAKGELDKINTIMIDEAHERSLNIDIIIGMLTQLLPRYPRLRLIIASATIAADKFINHFNKYLPQRKDAHGNVLPNCRYMEFEGKSFKVSPHFRTADENPLEYYREKLPAGPKGETRWEGRHRTPSDLSKHVAEKAIEILEAMYDSSPDGGYLIDHSGQKIDITERQGDILGFLHGEKPIEECCATVEKLAKSKLGDAITIKALPLYTTLAQSRQDEALKEREQPHDKLKKQLVQHLEDVIAGKKTFGDVLAILNNAGQIHNLCSDLNRKIGTDKSLSSLKESVVLVPWFTPATAEQLFETPTDPRRKMTLPPSRAAVMRIVVSTSRHRKALTDPFPTVIEIKSKEQRVVVSTNVAETSLTIHGILHVVDSGLINQNKWDATTQTSGVSPILQSRAGCKQRWGRAGRLQAGDAWLLYTEEQFGRELGEDDANSARVFDFYSRPEIARSPLEQVLLTAKKSGVESLDPLKFPWLDAPDSEELARSDRSLRQKGALDPDGDLTAHGVELGGMIGVDARVGNMLVVADRFACAVEMATIVAVATAERKGLKALLEYDKEWDDQSLQEVRRRQAVPLSGCRDDLDAALRLVACWEEVLAAGHAFVAMVKLYSDGDEITRSLDKSETGSKSHEILQQLNSVEDEIELESLLQEIHSIQSLKPRISDLRRAAEKALAAHKTFSRLAAVWQAIVHEWSFKTVWQQGVADPLIAKASRPLVNFLNRMVNADVVASPSKVSNELDRLSGSDRKAAEEALSHLPMTSARAWAKANYLVADAIASVITSRQELLEPLEAHKKGSEWRPLDLSRNNRLRVIFAHCLPDNTFIRNDSGRYKATSSDAPIVDLDVEPAADSVCANLPPELFVCVERRAGPAVEGKSRKLYASFLVALPTKWAASLSDVDEPFHTLSVARLGRFIAENCDAQPHFGKDLLLDCVFPKSALCNVRLERLVGNGQWQVSVRPPHARPPQVYLRPKRAGESDVVEQEAEETIRAPRQSKNDLALTRKQRSIRANFAVEDWDQSTVSAEQWENLFAATHLSGNDQFSGSRTLAVAEHVIRPVVRLDSLPGLLKVGTDDLQPGEIVLAEVSEILTLESGERRVSLSFLSSAPDPKKRTNDISVSNIGKTFMLKDLRLESLPLDGGTLLVAREVNSGMDVTFGPKDLSFSSCGIVPKQVLKALGGQAGILNAKLVQVDEDSGRVRMTTHHVFNELFPDAKILTGEQNAIVFQNRPNSTFVWLERGVEALKRGFMLVAKVAEGQIQGEGEGTRHKIYASYPSRVTESWPKATPPKDPQFEELSDGKLMFRGQVSRDQIDSWIGEVRSRRDSRSAIYSLYERSWQLNAMDEHEYLRWSYSIGRRVMGKVDRITDAGIQVALPDSRGVNTWLPREEFTWYCDEDVSQLSVGEEITVTGLEIDWERNQVLLSRRKLTENPYTKIRVGDKVDCEVLFRNVKGFVLSVNRLRGWAFAENVVRLPHESNDQEFSAQVARVNAEEGKLILDRWPILQTELRRLTANVVLKGKIIEFVNKEAIVELAPGIKASLWVGEVTNNQQASGLGERLLPQLKEVEVIVLPKQERDWDSRIRVSRKQAWSGFFQLSGAPGIFFGTGWTHVKAILEEITGRYGYCRVDAEKDRQGILRISGDSKASYLALVTRLQEHASNTRCTLQQESGTRIGPFWLADLPLQSTSHRPSRAGYSPQPSTSKEDAAQAQSQHRPTTLDATRTSVKPTTPDKAKKKSLLSWLGKFFTGE